MMNLIVAFRNFANGPKNMLSTFRDYDKQNKLKIPENLNTLTLSITFEHTQPQRIHSFCSLPARLVDISTANVAISLHALRRTALVWACPCISIQWTAPYTKCVYAANEANGRVHQKCFCQVLARCQAILQRHAVTRDHVTYLSRHVPPGTEREC